MKMYFSILFIYLLISFFVLIKFIDGSIKFYTKSDRQFKQLPSLIIALFSIFWPLVLYLLYRDRNEKL